MRLVAGIIVLTVALAAVKLWTPGAIGDWTSTGFMAGTALGTVLIVLAWVAGKWLRNRQRRRLMDTRDSALW